MNGQRWCALGGPAFVLLFSVGFIFCAGFMPAPAPTMPADELAAMYRDNSVMIRVGCALMMFATGLLLPWLSLISAQMSRIKTCSPALANTQLTTGTAVVAFLMLPILLWAVTAFRPERDPAMTQLLNDLAWLCLVTPVSIAVLQVVALGVAILGDRAAQPVFPRWAGYYNLWTGFIFVPGVAAMFARSGPFAWNGLLPYWIPFAFFGAWFLVMYVLLLGAIRQQEQQAAAGTAA